MKSSIDFPTIPLTAILVKDKKSGGFSAFFAQFPEAVAQGHDEKEAMENMIEVFKIMLLDKKQEIEQTVASNGFDYIEKPFNLTINEQGRLV